MVKTRQMTIIKDFRVTKNMRNKFYTG